MFLDSISTALPGKAFTQPECLAQLKTIPGKMKLEHLARALEFTKPSELLMWFSQLSPVQKDGVELDGDFLVFSQDSDACYETCPTLRGPSRSGGGEAP